MNGIQKTIKVFAICLAIFIIINIIGGILGFLSIITNVRIGNNKVVVESFSETYQNVNKIDINTISSNVIIKSGKEFKVEASNLKHNFSSKLRNGTIKIEEQKEWFMSNSNLGIITIYIPTNTTLDELEIDSGAGRIQIQDILIDKLDLDQGAGRLEISNSTFNKTKIVGGAGEINIKSSILNDLKMSAGVGRINLEAEITGNSRIECGIGDMRIKLLGNKEDYCLTTEKGVGNIKIDDNGKVNDTIYGEGKNKLRLEGGIGNIQVNFGQSQSNKPQTGTENI